MVTLSASGLASLELLQRDSALELENAALRNELAQEREDRALHEDLLVAELALAEQRRDTHVAAASASAQAAVARAAKAERARLVTSRELDLARVELEAAVARAAESEAKAKAATALANAAEAYALEVDWRLAEAERQRDAYRQEGAELRAYASRHLPEVAPMAAQESLDQLRADLERAKETEGAKGAYLIGVACSGLRTFEANAAGYGDRFGRRLLEEARALRLDPACLEFDGEEAEEAQTGELEIEPSGGVGPPASAVVLPVEASVP